MATLAVIWKAAGQLLATEASSIIEVLPPLAWRPATGVPACIRGLFVHRGRLIPLVDATRLLGADATADRMNNRVIVMRASGVGEARGRSWPVGVWVQGVLDLDHIDFGNEGSHPGFALDAARFLGPITKTRWGLVQLVKPSELFTHEQMELLSLRLSEAAA